MLDEKIQYFRALTTLPSPLTELLEHPGLKKNIRVFVKREDLTGGPAPGNKWRKMLPSIEKAVQLRQFPLVSFGGAFSNHLHALAGLGHFLGIKTVGIVRGTSSDPNNPTLRFCREQGMELYFLSKKDFDAVCKIDSSDANFGGFLGKIPKSLSEILEKYPRATIIRMGGSNTRGVTACAHLGAEILQQLDNLGLNQGKSSTFVGCGAGSGGTVSGIALGIGSMATVFGVAPMRGGLAAAEIAEFFPPEEKNTDLSVYPDVWDAGDLGGYGTMTPQVREFCRRFWATHGISLDPIYTGKLFYKVWEKLEAVFFPAYSTVVLVHTGGTYRIQEE